MGLSWFALAAVAVLSACGGAAPSSNSCVTDDDCKGKRICMAGFCQLPPDTGGDAGTSDGGGPDGGRADMGNFPATCFDNMLTGFETDIDCGGGMCPGCGDGKHCYLPGDCTGAMCVGNMCSSPASLCTDGKKDGKETDLDCGGGLCSPCSVGKGCAAPTDCLSGRCANAVCVGTLPVPPSFAATVSFPVAAGPVAMVVGDLNGDGKLDVSTANPGSNNVSVLMGRGDGSFQPKTDLSTNYAPYGIVRADFDGDGKQDLAVSLTNNNLGGILFSMGGGMFNPIVTFGTNSQPRGIAGADVDGDNKADLMIADENSSDVSSFFGIDNMGTAKMSPRFAVGARPHALLLVDVNADGKLDLITVDSGGGDINVLLNSGMGNFANPQSYRCNDTPYAVAAGDVNGDNKIDLLVVNNASGDVSVLIGKGDGTFPTGVNIPVGPGPVGIAAADLNSDGRLDIAVSIPSLGDVRVLVGFGNGTFAQPVSVVLGRTATALVAADFNKDNRIDLAALNGDSVGVLLNITQ